MNMIDYGNMEIFDWHSAWRDLSYACACKSPDLLAATGATLIYDQQEAK
jgi:hypothetical protein